MSLDDAKDMIRQGARFGDVLTSLGDPSDEPELRRWFVYDHKPVKPPVKVKTENTGNACPDCGGARLVRTGTCVTCQDCGRNEGCG